MYIKAINGALQEYPYTVSKLRKDNPTVAFPVILTEATLNEWNVYSVEEITPQTTDFQVVVKATTPVYIEGTWRLNNTVEYIPLASAKDMAKKRIKKEREAINLEAINDIEVSNSIDRENIEGSIEFFETLSAGEGYITWTLADSTERNLTLSELQAIKQNYVLRKGQSFKDYQTKKASIEAALTVEEIITILEG